MEFLHGNIAVDLPSSAFGGEIPDFMQGAYPVAKEDPEDKGLHVTFGTMAKLMTYKSQIAGYPIFENVDIVKIRFSKDGVTDEFVTDIPLRPDGSEHWKRVWYRTRFPKHWEFFQKQMGGEISGTPLTMIEQDPSILATLAAAKIKTVEKLAMVEGNILQIPGVQKARAKAEAFISSRDLLAVEMVSREELNKELQEAQAKIEELQKVMAKSREEEGEQVENDFADRSGSRKARKV